MASEITTTAPAKRSFVPARFTAIQWADSLFFVLCAAALVFLMVAYWGKSYDDVYLAFRYAQNIEQGKGFVFNPGEHFLGTPAPLFVVLLVVLHTLLPFVTIPQVGTIISATGLAAAGLAVYQVGRQTNQRVLGSIAAFLLMFNPYTLMVLGGETPLYLAFITWAICCFTQRRYMVAAVLLGLALMNRTEALVPIGLLFGLYTLEHRRLPIRMGLIVLAVLAPWLLFATITFGSPLTNSFTAKIAQVMAGADRYPTGLVHWIRQVSFPAGSLYWPMLPLLALGIGALAFAARPWQIIVAWAVLQTAAYASLPIPFYHWYAPQVGVLSAVLVAIGAVTAPTVIGRTARLLLRGAEQDNRRELGQKWRWTQFATVALVAVTLPLTCYAHAASARQYQKAWPHGPANAIYQQAGEWFAANTPADAKIAYLEIGQIAFYSDRYIIDTLGLVTPEVATHVGKKDWLWPLLRYKPDYIIYNPMFKDWTDSDAVFNESWFDEGFSVVHRIEVPPYPQPLIIFQRKPGATIPDPPALDLAQTKSELPVGEIYNNQIVRQTFTADRNGLAAVEILFATYARKNQGDVQITLLDDTSGVLHQWNIPANSIQDNAWRRFFFPAIADSAQRTYTIHIAAPNAVKESAVTVWRSAQPQNNAFGALFLGDEQQTGAIAFRTYVATP